jgi:hypothetical protein
VAEHGVQGGEVIFARPAQLQARRGNRLDPRHDPAF